MKTQEQVEAALAKYQEMLEANKKTMEFEGAFLDGAAFMDNKEVYISSAIKYHKAELVVFACEKLIKNCKWVLDIE